MTKMSKMHKRVLSAQGAMLALSAVLPFGTAMAQEATPAVATDGQLQQVTVTAQRRTENIKDVPVSVTALRGEKLDVLLSGGEDIRVLAAKVPSLNIESSNGRTFPRFYIRGYGNTRRATLFAEPPRRKKDGGRGADQRGHYPVKAVDIDDRYGQCDAGKAGDHVDDGDVGYSAHALDKRQLSSGNDPEENSKRQKGDTEGVLVIIECQYRNRRC